MREWFVVGISLAFIACGGGGGDDGSGDDGGDECSEQSDDCSGESICIDGFCEATFGREYSITDVDVEVPTTDANGDAWDVGGGAPDLMLEIYVNDSLEATTAAEQDSFTAFFAGPFNVELIGGNDLIIASLDEDLTVNDPAFTCTASPITAAMLRGRFLSCSSAGNSMSFAIEPR